jgi:hypothetical protein
MSHMFGISIHANERIQNKWIVSAPVHSCPLLVVGQLVGLLQLCNAQVLNFKPMQKQRSVLSTIAIPGR